MATKNAIGSNIPIEIAKGGTNNTSFTNYGVHYFDGTKIATTSSGTSGQVLTSNGAGSAPTYQSTSSTLLSTGDLTGNTVVVSGVGIENYRTLMLQFNLAGIDRVTVDVYLKLGTATANYQQSDAAGTAAIFTVANFATGGTLSRYGTCMTTFIYNNVTGKKPAVTSFGTSVADYTTTRVPQLYRMGGFLNDSTYTPFDEITISSGAGNVFNRGTYTLFGIN